METSKYGLDGLSDEALKARIDLQAKDLKVATKGTLVNRWEAGKRLTDKQIAHLKATNQIDEGELKTVMVKVPVIDKLTGDYMGMKNVPKSFNKLQVRLDRAVGEDVITDSEMIMSNNRRLAANAADLEDKNVVINHAKAELAASKAVRYAREELRIASEMEKKNLAFLSRKEIYEKAVAAQKLLAGDMREHIRETTPVVEVPA